jgi:hypothetical protein
MKMRTLTMLAATALLALSTTAGAQQQQMTRSGSKEGLSCNEREARCYDARGLCERTCTAGGGRADPQGMAECQSRCSKTQKACTDKLPAECDVLTKRGPTNVPRVVPQ